MRFAVSTGITAVLLISAGQTLSLLSRLDPRIIVLAITVVAGYLVYAQQLAATHRIGSTAMWFMIVPVVLSLAVGFYLGGPGVVASPVRLVDGLSASAGVGIAVVMIVIGWADNTLRTSALVGRWSRPRTLGGAVIIVALIVIGMMMLLGGAVLVPSMEFFTIPANLDMLPGLAGLMLMIHTILFTAFVAHALSGAARAGLPVDPGPADPVSADDEPNSESGAPPSEFAVAPSWLTAAAVVAAALALFDVGAPVLLLLVALVAAALMGAQLAGSGGDLGIAAGIVVAVVAAIVLLATGVAALGWWTSLAIVVTASVAYAVTFATRTRASARATPSAASAR
ncbi:hypothetical protein C6V83_02375 [Gordonia iterans]|uniref:Uncharacterized protein n=1 Tax=Gordonia iterans TaxID=1004901 RepID=A0A2S0KC98_9ACTN|nr:hypothetical protein [Gordonia iterans]AVL99312.1 hypothetical protein C6V83_02375 [Gordonia iterans]